MSIKRETLHKICVGLRSGAKYKQIASRIGCTPRTVTYVAQIKPIRVLFLTDFHCGSNVGLTPPAYQYAHIDNPITEDQRIRNKCSKLQG